LSGFIVDIYFIYCVLICFFGTFVSSNEWERCRCHRHGIERTLRKI